MPSKQMEKSDSSRIQSSQVKTINFHSVFYVRSLNHVINRLKVVVTCHRMASQRARNPQLTGIITYQLAVTKAEKAEQAAEQVAEQVAAAFR